MMILDTSPSEPLVIVPPAPSGGAGDEWSYSNLYCYDAPVMGDTSAPTSTTTASASTPTSSGVVPTNLPPRQVTPGSFDSSAFDAARARTVGSGNDGRGSSVAASTSAVGGRDPRRGAFTFRVHGEYDLLLHVQRDLDRRREENKTAADVELASQIRKSVDRYCLSQQWMYHVGSEKGAAIGRFLREGAERFHAENKRRGEVKRFRCVELGTYCGYSALVLASTLRQFVLDLQSSGDAHPFEFTVYTTEVSSKLLNVAGSVFRLAKMEGCIESILVQGEDGNDAPTLDNGGDDPRAKYVSESSLATIDAGNSAVARRERDAKPLSRTLAERGVASVDFLLLDHAKHRYLPDLRDLERAGLIRAGTRAAADNVVFNRLDAYRAHVRGHEGRGVAESRLEEMNLEYSNNLKDGIEMTLYLKDPPANNE